MSYTHISQAPINHFSLEFLDYLRDNNVVIYEDMNWLVIENCKYHKKNAPWFTAFYKQKPTEPWWKNMQALVEIWGDWKWIKKSVGSQTVRRFHIHLVKE